jgi:hypothetical protein
MTKMTTTRLKKNIKIQVNYWRGKKFLTKFIIKSLKRQNKIVLLLGFLKYMKIIALGKKKKIILKAFSSAKEVGSQPIS